MEDEMVTMEEEEEEEGMITLEDVELVVIKEETVLEEVDLDFNLKEPAAGKDPLNFELDYNSPTPIKVKTDSENSKEEVRPVLLTSKLKCGLYPRQVFKTRPSLQSQVHISQPLPVPPCQSPILRRIMSTSMSIFNKKSSTSTPTQSISQYRDYLATNIDDSYSLSLLHNTASELVKLLNMDKELPEPGEVLFKTANIPQNPIPIPNISQKPIRITKEETILPDLSDSDDDDEGESIEADPLYGMDIQYPSTQSDKTPHRMDICRSGRKSWNITITGGGKRVKIEKKVTNRKASTRYRQKMQKLNESILEREMTLTEENSDLLKTKEKLDTEILLVKKLLRIKYGLAKSKNL